MGRTWNCCSTRLPFFRGHGGKTFNCEKRGAREKTPAFRDSPGNGILVLSQEKWMACPQMLQRYPQVESVLSVHVLRMQLYLYRFPFHHESLLAPGRFGTVVSRICCLCSELDALKWYTGWTSEVMAKGLVKVWDVTTCRPTLLYLQYLQQSSGAKSKEQVENRTW